MYTLYLDDLGNIIKSTYKYMLDFSKITIKGRFNIFILANNINIDNFVFNVRGDYNLVQIGQDAELRGKVAIKGHYQIFTVGRATTFQSVSVYINEGCHICIGEDCMFSARIELRTSDSHSIIDLNTGKRLNNAGSIYIGDHVWIGKDTMISKGVRLGNHVIVGAKSFVNQSCIENYIILAGVPAKIVRKSVTWSRELIM